MATGMMELTEDRATSDAYNELWNTLADIAETQCETVSSSVENINEDDEFSSLQQDKNACPINRQLHHVDKTEANYPGMYEFTVSFPSPPKETKSTTWTYSKTLKKLYIRMAAACPVNFKTKSNSPSGCVIRATPVFLKPQHSREIVTRCPTHASSRDFSENHPAPSHLVRCDHRLARYSEDGFGRPSVIIPFEKPQVGCDFTTNLYQFMCLGSCVGGPNRRPLKIIFTLEKDDIILGHHSYEVRICACPGRDRRVEECAIVTKGKSLRKTAVQRNLISRIKTENNEKLSEPEYEISVRGEEHFKLLCKIRDALEIASVMRQQQNKLEMKLDLKSVTSSYSENAQTTTRFSGVDSSMECLYNSSPFIDNMPVLTDISSIDNIEPSIPSNFNWKSQNTHHVVDCQYTNTERLDSSSKRRKF